jgi:hypothetical protein
LLGLFCGASGFSHGWAAEGETSIEPQVLFRDLEQRRDVAEHLVEASSWDESILEHRKFEGVLLGLLSDGNLPKSDRFVIFGAIEDLSIEKEVIPQDKVAEILLKLLPKLSSPNLRVLCVEMLVGMDNLKSSSTSGKIGKLVDAMVSDASKDLKKQVYPASLHAIAIRALDGSKITSTQLKTIEALLDKVKDLGPQLRLSLFDVIEQAADAAPSSFKKKTKQDLTKKLVALLAAHPALPKVGSRPQEQMELVHLLRPLSILAADEDNSDVLSKVTPDLLKALAHKNLNIVHQAGLGLLNITKADLPKSKLKFENELFALLKTPGKDDDGVAREIMYYEFLGSSLEVLLQSEKASDVDDRIAKVITFLHNSVMTHVNMEMRERALDGLFSIEPRHFEGKLLDKDARKVLKKFVLDCSGVMASPEMVKQVPDLVESMSAVLHEMTGKNLGMDAKEWGAWLRKDGAELF